MNPIPLLLGGLFISLAATAQRLPLPGLTTVDPVNLISVYNSGNSTNYKTYFTTLTNDTAQINANSRRMQREFAQTGPLRLMKTTALSPTQTELIVKTDDYDSWWKLLVFTDSVQAFKEHRMLPIRLPGEFLNAGKRTQAQVLAGIDQYIDKLMAKQAFGGNILLARNNEVLYQRSFGTNPNHQPNTASQSFHLASMSKLFTSISVLQLADRGLLALDDQVGSLMPQLTNKALYPITVRQLLMHTSGMGDFFEDPTYTPEPGKILTGAQLLPIVERDRLHSSPGNAFRYSNTGYLLLGLIVEKRSGQPFADYVAKHILQPAGMKNTQIDNGAGGGYATLADVYQFAKAIRGGTLLTTSTAAAFQTDHTADWGLGQEYQTIGQEVITGHSGGYPGVCTELNIYRHSGYTVVILSNTDPPYGHFLSDKIKELVLSN